MVSAFAGLVPFQVALVVRDLERAVGDLDSVVGAGPWRSYLFGADTVEGREYHGHAADWSVRLVLNDRRPQFELIESVTGPNIYFDWLEDRGEGLHHLAYEVDSLEQETSEMVAAGHAVIQSGHSFGAEGDGAFAYYDTAEVLGFIIEAVEPPTRLPEPAFRL